MLWQEDESKPKSTELDSMIDLLFQIDCRELPVDHLYALSRALFGACPLLEETPGVGIHEIHLAGTQNGWERPDPDQGQKLILSRRTKLTIRVPSEIESQIRSDLHDQVLDIHGHKLAIGKAKGRPLSNLHTLFARHIALQPGEDQDEDLLLQRLVKELESRDIRIRKALCGMTQSIQTPDGPLRTRSILLADLTGDAAANLQCEGLGSHRHMGCGIFLPHKGIEAVNKQQKD